MSPLQYRIYPTTHFSQSEITALLKAMTSNDPSPKSSVRFVPVSDQGELKSILDMTSLSLARHHDSIDDIADYMPSLVVMDGQTKKDGSVLVITTRVIVDDGTAIQDGGPSQEEQSLSGAQAQAELDRAQKGIEWYEADGDIEQVFSWRAPVEKLGSYLQALEVKGWLVREVRHDACMFT